MRGARKGHSNRQLCGFIVIKDEFKAKDHAGNVYHVFVLRTAIHTPSRDGLRPIPEQLDFRLADGRALERVSETVFEIARTSAQIIRV